MGVVGFEQCRLGTLDERSGWGCGFGTRFDTMGSCGFGTAELGTLDESSGGF